MSAGFAVNGDICVNSSKKNSLGEGLKQTSLVRELVGYFM